MKKKKSLMLIALLMMVGLTSGYVASTYAKYTASVSGNGSVTVAKWDFANENAFGDEGKSFTVNLDGTYHASTLVAGKIAPGTQGSFDVALTNADSEVGVDFSVTVGTVTDKPTNLKFYTDNTYSTELTASDPITGQIAAQDGTGVTLKVYWQWVYETGTVTAGIAEGDQADTEAGLAASSLTVPITIKGVQHQPGAEIETHID